MTVRSSDKIKIYQDFYYRQNGVRISYREALYYYKVMNSEERKNFEEFYKDETGYEIIPSKGYGLDIYFDVYELLDENGNNVKKEVTKKEVQEDGTVKRVKKQINVLESDGSGYIKAQTYLSMTLASYAKQNGIEIDDKWAVYSAEEIIQMEGNGVFIPQEVLDIAHSIYDSQIHPETDIEGDEGDDAIGADEFVKLIPKTQKKIQKCEENNEKISDKIEEIIPETNRKQKALNDKLENQTKAFQEYEARLREWRTLQNKVNNGEELTNSEAKRYADIIGMLNDKNIDDEDFGFDKNAIAKSINELNILSILGEKLANEVIDISDQLSDYTANVNYKANFKQTKGLVGSFAAHILMITGKNLAKEANEIGNDTKGFSQDSKKTVSDIADIIEIDLADVENVTTSEDEFTLQDSDTQTDINDAEEIKPDETDADNVTADTETKDEIKSPEVSAEEDFVLNDEAVKELTNEAVDINGDLLKQAASAVKSIVVARDDRSFAKIAGKKVTELVKQFKEEEEKRQARIEELENENKSADEEIQNLTGKSAEEDDNSETDKNNPDANKVNSNKQKIASNKNEIEGINAESEAAREKFINQTTKESERISKSVPKETEALEKDSEQKEKIIPESKERLGFVSNTGKTYTKMGTYRVIVGMQQIATFMFIQGLKNIAKGTISTTLGLGAQVASNTPIPAIAEKFTNESVKEENKAITSLTDLDAQIVSVTGQSSISPQTNEEQGDAQNEDGEAATTEGAPSEETTPADNVVDANVAQSVNTMSTSSAVSEETSAAPVKTTTTATTGAAAPVKETPSTEGVVSNETSLGKKTKDEVDEDTKTATDKDAGKVEDIGSSAKEDLKESEKLKKDTEKDEKQLNKEAKKIEKEMQKDQKEIESMTQESQRAVQKQAELFVQYETLTVESEQLVSEVEQAQQGNSAPAANTQTTGASAGFAASPAGSGSGKNNEIDGKIQTLQANELIINTLGNEFKVHGNKITRNQKKIKKLEKKTKTNTKKLEKKCKLRVTKLKKSQKAEEKKQKNLQKQLGAVGIAENAFSITTSVGTILGITGKIMYSTGLGMLSNPSTAVAGAALMTSGGLLEAKGDILTTIGTYGTVACGVTKGIINIANGNLAAGLMAIGSAAISAATASAGVSGSSNAVFSMAGAGLQIVSSSAELVNNVRAVQGKEASETMSKIGTVAGVAGSLTNAASGFTKGGSFSKANTFGKAMQITSAVGTVASSASQIMTTFNLGDQQTAQLIGMVGSGLQTAASAVQIAQSFAGAKNQNKNTKERADALENNNNDNNSNTDNKSNNSNNNKQNNDVKNDNKTNPANDTTNTNQTTNTTQTSQGSEGKGIFGKVGNLLKKVGGGIGNALNGAFGAVKNSSLGQAIANITNKIGSGINTAAAAVGNVFKKDGAIGKAFTKEGFFGKALNKTENLAKKGIEGTKTTINTAAAKLGLSNQNAAPTELQAIAPEIPQLELNTQIDSPETLEIPTLDNGTYGQPEQKTTTASITPEQLNEQIEALPICPDIEIDNDAALAGMAALQNTDKVTGTMSTLDKIGQWLEFTSKIAGTVGEALSAAASGQKQQGNGRRRQPKPVDPAVMAKLRKWKQQREKRMLAYQNYQYRRGSQNRRAS